MKKLISTLLILVMLFSFASCGSKEAVGKIGDEEHIESLNNNTESQASVTEETMKGVVSSIPFKWSFVSNDGAKEIYEIKVDKDYSPDNDANYSVWYGKEGAPQSFMVKMKCSLAELKEGVQVGVPIGQVALLQNNNVAGVLRITEDDRANKEQKVEKIIAKWGEEYRKLVSEDHSKIALPEYATEGVTYKELAEVYCKDANLSYIVNPITEDDHWNNICYAFLTANWEYSADKKEKFIWSNAKDAYSGEMLYCRLNEALFGYYQNGAIGKTAFCYDGISYYRSEYDIEIEKLLTPKELQTEIIEVYKLARKKYNDFRAKGYITAESTQSEIAKVYSDWMCSLTITHEDIKEEDHALSDIYWPEQNAAYGALIDKNCMCAGRSAGFSLLMAIEGIPAHGFNNVQYISNKLLDNHIVPWLLLDGEEYIYEYNNGVGLHKLNLENMSQTIHGVEYRFDQQMYKLILKEEGIL